MGGMFGCMAVGTDMGYLEPVTDMVKGSKSRVSKSIPKEDTNLERRGR